MSQAKTIKEQIGFLKELQVVDSEIYALNREKNSIPKQLKTIEEKLETKKTGIRETEKELKNLQLKLKESEISLQQKEEQIKKLEIQLYQLKSNTEYSAMLTEIRGLKADGSVVEDNIIKRMDEIEILKKKMADEKEFFKKEEESAQNEEDVINRRKTEIGNRLSELSTQRERITPNIEKQVLAKYERVLKNRDGLAIVPVESGACGGCYMNLPPQVVSEAKLKEDIVICASCSRILYIDDDVEIY